MEKSIKVNWSKLPNRQVYLCQKTALKGTMMNLLVMNGIIEPEKRHETEITNDHVVQLINKTKDDEQTQLFIKKYLDFGMVR
jgi:hypothetical protein